MSSLPKKNEGVAMYVRKDLGLKAIMHEEWSSNMMMVANGQVAVVTVYISQGWRKQLMSDLNRTVNQLRESGYMTVVTGDFNAPVDVITKFCARELKLSLSKSPVDGTRHGRNGAMATLDYLMASPELQPSDTECVE
jgi:exonuclease III